MEEYGESLAEGPRKETHSLETSDKLLQLRNTHLLELSTQQLALAVLLREPVEQGVVLLEERQVLERNVHVGVAAVLSLVLRRALFERAKNTRKRAWEGGRSVYGLRMHVKGESRG